MAGITNLNHLISGSQQFQKSEINSRLGNNSIKLQGSSNATFLNILENSVQNINKTWGQADSRAQNLIKSVPAEYRSVLETQILMSKCNYQTEIFTKIIDSVQSSIKKLQQQG